MYRITEPLFCAPGTNITLYVNHTGNKNKKKKKEKRKGEKFGFPWEIGIHIAAYPIS